MTYTIAWHEEISGDLKTVDIHEAKKLILKISTYLVQNPLSIGKPLTGEYKGLYRYRFGNYRIIYKIDSEDNLIKILYIAHRKEIYLKHGRH